MKSKANKIENKQIQTIDGPPLDFSFKNLRHLQQINDFLPKTQQHSAQIQQKTTTLVPDNTQPTNNDEQKQVNEPKLEIIRTIETNDHQYLEQKNSKTIRKKEVSEKKAKKVIIPQTTSIFLRYNKFTSLQGLDKVIGNLFPNISNLMWIDLSHNRFDSLPSQFNLPSLKTLYLHANYIYNFKEIEKLKNTSLRTLTIYANPLQQIEEFRVIIHSILPELKKLDSTLLTKREKQRAEVLMKSIKKLPAIKNPRKPPTQSDNEEDD